METEKKVGEEGPAIDKNTKTAELIDDNESKKRKIWLTLAIGILLGFVLKGAILRDYVIGFEDYRVGTLKSDFNYKEFINNQKKAAEMEAASGNVEVQGEESSGGSCSN